MCAFGLDCVRGPGSVRTLLLTCALLLFSCFNSAAGASPPSIAPVMKCETLNGELLLAGAVPIRITSARPVLTETPGPYCEVRGYVAPQVAFELRLPLNTWSQRLLFTGCGGFCGQINIRSQASEGCQPAENGEFAVVSSNLGHQSSQDSDLVWSYANYQGIIDWGSRGVHVVTLAARQIIADFYGRGPRYVYFVGCSDGGREALMAAQRYPGDFNGIVAGAPVTNVTTNNSLYHAWIVQHLLNPDGTLRFTDQFLEKLSTAVTEQCGSLDVTQNDFVVDPERCAFSPRSILCDSGVTTSWFCLTSEEASVIAELYLGPTTGDGDPLYFGLPRGSEAYWNEQAKGSLVYGSSFVSLLSTDGSVGRRNIWGVRFSHASLRSFAKYSAELDALSSNLEPFRRLGGKLLIWHGWADSGVPPMNSITYFKTTEARMGFDMAERFMRLFMLPGVRHCGGGKGPSHIDLLTPLMAWVEDGEAPESVTARSASGATWQIRGYPSKPERPH
jgi:pimeloyl-ACP methyl ester carboxylesterase